MKWKHESVLLAGMLLGLHGCAVVAAGAAGAGVGVGTYSYLHGELQRNYEAPLTSVWDATVAAVEQLQVTPQISRHDAFGGVIEGELYDGKNIVIELKPESNGRTRVAVRVGLIGDRQKSEFVHEIIASKLESGKA